MNQILRFLAVSALFFSYQKTLHPHRRLVSMYRKTPLTEMVRYMLSLI
ncbi:hypothetical protein [Runella sp.]